MNRRRDTSGLTLLELMVVLALIGTLVGIGGLAMREELANSRAKGAARDLADLLMLARAEAIRTTTPHIVFFDMDAEDNPLDAGGSAAVVVKDSDENGVIDSGETVATVPVDLSGKVAWGSGFGSTAAPDDSGAALYPNTGDFICCTFREEDEATDARWVIFQPDGIPRGFSTNGSDIEVGDIGSGGGAVYLTSGSRDYAVVLAPLGSVRVHVRSKGGGGWTD